MVAADPVERVRCKYLAHAGVASRRAAETLIAEGRVSVDGEVVTDPARDVGEDSARGGRRPARSAGPSRGSSTPSTSRSAWSPPRATRTAARRWSSSCPAQGLRLYPVGRLDADSSGLILLTNDGELANRLTHPRFEVPKTYRARARRRARRRGRPAALRDGVELEDGPTAPARVRRAAGRRIELTIHEGRNRQVRRMCEAVGHPVLELRRIGFGPLRLGGLGRGAHRRLSAAEVERLRAL